MKTILVPVDFSEVTPRVMETAAAFARDLKATIFLLHVVPPPVVMTAYGITKDHIPDFLGQEQEQARKELKIYREDLLAQGMEVSALTVQGPPIESILLVAKEHEADMLVMGSHGHGAFYEFIVGSTTRGVLKGFPGPVVLVPSRLPGEVE
jgi:universal stress protein A